MTRKEVLLVSTVNVLCGTSFAVIKPLSDILPPLTIAFLRLGVAGLVLLPWIARSWRNISRRDYLLLLVMALPGMAFPTALNVVGTKHSTAVNAALLLGAEPVFIMLLAVWVLKDRIHAVKIMALVLSTVGMALIAVGNPFESGFHFHPGDVALIVSAATWSMYTIVAKMLITRVDSMTLTAWGSALSALAVLPFAAAEFGELAAVEWSWHLIGTVLYISLALNVYAYWRWNTALETISGSDMAPFLNFQPLTGAVMGVCLLGEELTAATVVGGVLIMIGVYLVASEKAEPARPAITS